MTGPAVRRLAQAVAGQVTNPSVYLHSTTVTVVTPGASLDGVAAVSVAVNADNVPAPYLASYLSPTVGDQVSVLLIDHSPLILGRVVGLPNF